MLSRPIVQHVRRRRQRTPPLRPSAQTDVSGFVHDSLAASKSYGLNVPGAADVAMKKMNTALGQSCKRRRDSEVLK